MTPDQARWVVEWCTTTGSLLFLWDGTQGIQPVLMPGFTYYWWLDDDSALLHQAAEDDGSPRRGDVLH